MIDELSPQKKQTIHDELRRVEMEMSIRATIPLYRTDGDKFGEIIWHHDGTIEISDLDETCVFAKLNAHVLFDVLLRGFLTDSMFGRDAQIPAPKSGVEYNKE